MKPFPKVLFLALTGTTLVAQSSCKVRSFFEKSEVKNDYSTILESKCDGNEPLSSLEHHLNPTMKLSEEETQENSVPKILRFKRPPPYEILLSKEENPFFEHASKNSEQDFPSTWNNFSDETFDAFLNGMNFGAINAHYYFMGGGGYLGALIAKTIFAGTSAEKRFLPMLLSRDAIKLEEEKQKHFAFFDRLCIHKAKMPFFVLLDSFVPEEHAITAYKRSNVQIAMQLRDYLKHSQKISDGEAVFRVMPAGPTEAYRSVYAAPQTLKHYFVWARKIPTTLEKGGQVYLRYPQIFWDKFLLLLYNVEYWKGNPRATPYDEKYRTFDELNMPTNMPRFGNMEHSDQVSLFEKRKQQVKFYLAIYFRAKEFAEKNQEKIREIAKKMEETEPKF